MTHSVHTGGTDIFRAELAYVVESINGDTSKTPCLDLNERRMESSR